MFSRIYQQQGFTLIEMIVSLALFSMVATVSIGALLMFIGTNEQVQGEQSVMTNLSFALDSMTREIRTGTNYYCLTSPITTGTIFSDGANMDSILGDSVRDCQTGNPGNVRFHGVSFKEAGDSITEASERILYYFDVNEGKIFRKIGNQAGESIVSDGIFVSKAEFFVTGTTPLEVGGTNRDIQPVVTIFITAREVSDPTAKPYNIQTTVTQRTLDI